MQEVRNSPLRPKTFGLLLGTITIDGMSIPLYSNGDSLYVSDQKTYDKKGRYLALAYHCVVGLCPGPAVASLHEDALVFFVSMIAGMYAYGTLHVIGSHEPDGGASALDQTRGKP